MKTLIAVPCMDMVAAPFAQSLATLNREGECLVSFLIGSLIYDSRNTLCKQAITHDCDYVLWFDSDMVFEPDVLQKMLRHMEDGKDIVTGLYFRRRPPFTPVIFSEITFDEDERGTAIGYEDYPEDELFEVEACGFGCVMVRKEVLLDVLLNYRTWFNPLYGAGEDIAFCVRAKELGYKIWCDPTIKLGHYGSSIINEEIFKAGK